MKKQIIKPVPSKNVAHFAPKNNSVIIKTEWLKLGDYFEQFSIYDNAYLPVESLGGTTLIKNM
jgi:hypothetical protein